MNKTIGKHIWSSINGVSDFMKAHFKRYFPRIIGFSIVSASFCTFLAVLVSLRFIEDFETGNSLLYAGVFYHLSGTGTSLGIICASLLAMAIKNDLDSETNGKFNIITSLKRIGSAGWLAFGCAAVFVFLLNLALYKDVFNTGYSLEGFRDILISDLQIELYHWLNNIVNLIKSFIPYALGGLAYLSWRVPDFKSNWKVFVSSLISLLLMCYAVDAVFIKVIYEVYELVLTPLQFLFKSEVFTNLFSWIVFTPIIAFFLLLSAAVFITAIEDNLEKNGSKNDHKEELFFPSK